LTYIAFFSSSETIEFKIPKIHDTELLHFFDIKSGSVEVPVLLIRDDGVIFPTGLTFTYQNVICNEK
jgi:hypothetical protein